MTSIFVIVVKDFNIRQQSLTLKRRKGTKKPPFVIVSTNGGLLFCLLSEEGGFITQTQLSTIGIGLRVPG